jgi:hypothetical protein
MLRLDILGRSPRTLEENAVQTEADSVPKIKTAEEARILHRDELNSDAKRVSRQKTLAGLIIVATAGSIGTALRVDRTIGQALKPADKVGSHFTYVKQAPFIGSLSIKDGANIRYNPSAIDTVEGTNKCDSIGENLKLDKVPTYYTEGDVNGPWTGIELPAMPESVQNACNKDEDGVIWVADSNIQ